MMNGFADRDLDESNFGVSQSSNPKDVLRTFDAFPKTKATYTTRSSRGGQWTIVLLVIVALLSLSETRRWYAGHETHQFSVEKGVSHGLQINLDMVVAMRCQDLHVNVQDASGDHILAGERVRRDPTNWSQWVDAKGVHRLGRGRRRRRERGGPGMSGSSNSYGDSGDAAGQNAMDPLKPEELDDEHVGDVMGRAHWKKKFPRTPRLKGEPTACRIYGSIEGNKVQGDFHITARGHGYIEYGTEHLDHKSFNFSHITNELSFGPYYPSLVNPLDSTLATTDSHFYKFQYYLSVVPTIYTRSLKKLAKLESQLAQQFHKAQAQLSSSSSSSSSFFKSSSSSQQQQPILQPRTLADLPASYKTRDVVMTNQYAVTEQSLLVGERSVPGIFFKFDIEPILLTIAEERGSMLALLVRLVNVISGVLVAGGWCYQLGGWAIDVLGGKRFKRKWLGAGTRRESEGVLHGKMEADEE
ncbi:DUF1692-domain-containing protein [Xylona heveae TC161]|uniref:Endoplasmic reticulum-Golgi intermediate compartment protein n=1 Tax=Xylona heveae (strain CBS 132557 / TC161) TaxID=1328760 RepID=A0A165HIV1_XYLHT|nr:DUF1692-domain-containing protein [Xylona heveae TC161]KZF23584.1 DUF1692-domain-containing protein [Xylona heveae TC161]